MDGKTAPTHSRIGTLTAIVLIAAAVILDAIQVLFSFLNVIPIVGIATFIICMFIGFFAYILFGVWFALLGVNYFSGKQAALKLLAVFGTIVVEIIPLLSALPAIVGGVVVMIVATRIEDTVGNLESLEKLKTQRDAQIRAAATAEEQRKVMMQQQRENQRIAAQIATNRKAEEERKVSLPEPANDNEPEGERRAA